MKTLLQWSLLAVVFLGVSAAVMKSLRNGGSELTEISETVSNAQAEAERFGSVTVTYFTTDARCVSCRKIEAFTRLAVETNFPDQLVKESLTFETINVDRPENKHFIRDYEIAFKTVVIAYTDSEGNPQFRKMDKVWELLPDQEAFERYIASAVQEAIDGAAS